MTNYFFSMERSPDRDSFAATDQLGGSIMFYLGEFNEDIHESLYSSGETRDDMILAVFKAVLIHEHFHLAVMECVDTTGGQEHDTIFQWVQDWLDDRRE